MVGFTPLLKCAFRYSCLSGVVTLISVGVILYQMNTGSIKKWFSNRGFGFIEDHTEGYDIFFHINESRDLRNNETVLVPGARVTFRKRTGRRGKTEAYDVRLQGNYPKLGRQGRASIYKDKLFFNNPYAFIYSPSRKNIANSSFADDFDPLEHGLGHDRLMPKLWTGYLPIKLTMVTPLLLPDVSKANTRLSQHKVYDMLNHLPESSLRGMLRNAYEIATNSRYACFRNDERLSFRVHTKRELYECSPKDLLDTSLRPAESRNESSPAERLFGWVPQLAGSDEGYQGRIRVVCEDGERPDIVQSFNDGKALPLTILGQPKPTQGRFYVAKNATGGSQEGVAKSQAGYSKGKTLRGRKQYWHHKGLEYDQALDYWQPSAEDRTQDVRNGRFQEYRRPDDRNGKPQTDSQNCSIKGWIKPNTIFRATLHLHNLQPEEIGALLWLLSLPLGHFFKLGYGKPLGFGSMKLEIDWERSAEDKRLPLGMDKDWKSYYATLDAQPPAVLDTMQQAQCIQAFKSSMVAAYATAETIEATRASEQTISKTQRFDSLSFIKEYLQVLKGPSNNDPVHYPRLEYKPNRNGENFKWFVKNEKEPKHALPSVTEKQGLPYFYRS